MILIVLASIAFSSTRINSTNPDDLKKFPTFLFIYYNHLVAPALVGTLLVVLIFKRNAQMRRTVFDEMKNLFLNIMETFREGKTLTH
jgi:hypothetical protein